MIPNRMVFLLLAVFYASAMASRGPLSAEENAELQKICGRKFPESVSRSMNAGNATRYEAPFAVMVDLLGDTCSGALISSRHVVTAAHCIYKARGCPRKLLTKPHLYCPIADATIKAPTVCTPLYCDNTLQGVKIGIKKIYYNTDYMHSKCPHALFLADIAIVELEEDVELTNEVHPVCLGDEEPADNTTISMFGYGDDGHGHSLVLRKHIARVLSEKECLAYSNFNHYNPSKKVTDDLLCSRNETAMACVGDSGSGHFLYKNDRAYLVGVLSKGPACRLDLTSEMLMDFSVRTVYYNPWICAVSGVCVGQFRRTDLLVRQFKDMHFIFSKGED